MATEYQAILDEAFPAGTDAEMIRGVTEGILLADAVLKGEKFLSSPIGFDIRGHLRRAGILFRLNEMCRQGDLPFVSSISRMPRGNWHWLEISSGSVVAHVCRTDGPDLFPDDTPTRQDERLSNQGDLFLTTDNVVPIKGYSAWLTFGAGDSGHLAHLCWGMPNAKEDIWLARTNIIRRAAENDSVFKFDRPSRSVELKFKEHIEEGIRESEDRSTDKSE